MRQAFTNPAVEESGAAGIGHIRWHVYEAATILRGHHSLPDVIVNVELERFLAYRRISAVQLLSWPGCCETRTWKATFLECPHACYRCVGAPSGSLCQRRQARRWQRAASRHP